MMENDETDPRQRLRPNQNDRLHDLQLQRDVRAINEQTMRAFGPLPPDGLPVQPKRKPHLPKPESLPQEHQNMTHPHDAQTLSNGLPPPPIPQRLREMLKDYPGHLARLQQVLNFVLDGPNPARGSTNHVFEEVTWVLESRLGAFIHEAQDELEAAQASGDAEVIARAEAKEFLMGIARSSNAGMKGLHDLWNYLELHQEALK